MFTLIQTTEWVDGLLSRVTFKLFLFYYFVKCEEIFVCAVRIFVVSDSVLSWGDFIIRDLYSYYISYLV